MGLFKMHCDAQKTSLTVAHSATVNFPGVKKKNKFCFILFEYIWALFCAPSLVPHCRITKVIER